MQNNTTTCKRHPLVSPQFANEDDDDDEDGTIEPEECSVCLDSTEWCVYTHSMVKALGTLLQQHGYSA